jgi:hypothetical protein
MASRCSLRKYFEVGPKMRRGFPGHGSKQILRLGNAEQPESYSMTRVCRFSARRDRAVRMGPSSKSQARDSRLYSARNKLDLFLLITTVPIIRMSSSGICDSSIGKVPNPCSMRKAV